jgi:hypothetical protein
MQQALAKNQQLSLVVLLDFYFHLPRVLLCDKTNKKPIATFRTGMKHHG